MVSDNQYSIYTHFSTDRIRAKSVRGLKQLQRPRAEETYLKTSIDMPSCRTIFATQRIWSYQCKITKSSQETERSLQKFLELTRKRKNIYTANALEFGKVCEGLS